jgi:hypothetical protein
MRDNFPRDTVRDSDADYDLQVQPEADDGATMVDMPLRAEEFAPPTVEYRGQRESDDTDESRWGTLDDLAQGPNPESIEYLPDVDAVLSESTASSEVAVITDTRPRDPAFRAPPRYAGPSMEMVGASPQVTPVPNVVALPQPPPELDDDTTNGAKRNVDSAESAAITGSYASQDAGPPRSRSTGSLTDPFLRAHAGGDQRNPGSSLSQLPPIGRPLPAARRTPLILTQGIGVADGPARGKSSRWNSILVLAALFLLVLAGATSITLAVKNSGRDGTVSSDAKK